MNTLHVIAPPVTVTLVDFTGAGRPDAELYAAHKLIFTKSTRLDLSPGLFEEIQSWPRERVMEELQYMASTIPSSWEFCNVTFLITGLTRAAAQQMTRTRTASYAMQSLRVVEASAVGVTNPFPAPEQPLAEDRDLKHELFNAAAAFCKNTYATLVARGAKAGDARGILPLNTHCNIVAEYNLRALVDLVLARRSLRTQEEYADVVRQMETAVLAQWPWAEAFFTSPFDKAIELLSTVAEDVGITVGSGAGWQIAKAIDLLRKAR